MVLNGIEKYGIITKRVSNGLSKNNLDCFLRPDFEYCLVVKMSNEKNLTCFWSKVLFWNQHNICQQKKSRGVKTRLFKFFILNCRRYFS